MLTMIFWIWQQKHKQQKQKSTSGTIKSFCTARNNRQNEKATYEMEENICKSYIW